MADLIAGRYELGNPVGAGGMAEVFRAHDHQLDRTVAVKILNQAYTAQPAFVERFRREAQAAASLDHPAIVPIYDWGETDESYFIVMAYVDGQTLRDWFRGQNPAPVDEVLPTISRVASGLQHAHDRGIVHRDIKPQNIMIDQEGNPRITDFGIARAAGQTSLTETSMVLGTATYISPEQAMRRPVDARSDIYSLGAVTYELLAGQPPFEGESIVDLAMQHVHEDPPRLRSIREDVPEGVEQIVLTCLAKDPDQRIQSAGELASALDRVRANPAAVPVTAPTVPVAAAAPVGESTRPVQSAGAGGARPARGGSKGAVWAAIALVGLAVVVLLAVLISQLGGPDDPDSGVTGDESADPTTETDEGVAPGGTEEPVEEEAPPEGAGEETDDEPAPTEPQEQQEQQGTQPSEGAPGQEGETPPDEPPAEAPGQEENQGDEESPPDENGDEQSAEPQSAAVRIQENGICEGTFESGDVGGFRVPGNSTCSLISGRVSGEVVVEPGGTFQAVGVEILDDIQAEQAASVSLTGSSYVDGNIQYSSGGTLRVSETTVEGNLELEDNSGAIQINDNIVNGNIQVESNTGSVTITNNQVDGNLECEENDPPPSGGGNAVAGGFEDQCADL